MEINVLIDKGFEGYLEVSWLRSVAEQVLVAQDAGSRVEMGLVITGQERVQQLNRNYRGRDEPTDVLAFSAREEIDTRKAAGCTSSEANRWATAKQCLENHRKPDSAGA